MEKLVAVKDDPSYDLVVLDTPPTTNALDFLDAPQRLIGALDSAAMKWFVQAFESSGKLSLNLLARSAAAILRGIGKITGGGFLEDMAGFLVELNDMFGGFKQRAARVEAELRGPDVAFVLVTSPSPASLHEVTYFAERLAEAGMPRGAFVVNRFRLPPPPLGARSPGDVDRAIAEHALTLAAGAETRLLQAHADADRLAALDAAAVRRLDTDGVPLVLVPELASDVYDVALLGALGDSLIGGGVKGDGGKARGAA